jgi:hypothetical protein
MATICCPHIASETFPTPVQVQRATPPRPTRPRGISSFGQQRQLGRWVVLTFVSAFATIRRERFENVDGLACVIVDENVFPTRISAAQQSIITKSTTMRNKGFAFNEFSPPHLVVDRPDDDGSPPHIVMTADLLGILQANRQLQEQGQAGLLGALAARTRRSSGAPAARISRFSRPSWPDHHRQVQERNEEQSGRTAV